MLCPFQDILLPPIQLKMVTRVYAIRTTLTDDMTKPWKLKFHIRHNLWKQKNKKFNKEWVSIFRYICWVKEGEDAIGKGKGDYFIRMWIELISVDFCGSNDEIPDFLDATQQIIIHLERLYHYLPTWLVTL